MQVERITTGRWRQNGYVLAAGGEALVIDPGAEPERFVEKMDELGAAPRGILLTHAHYDHVGAVEPLRARWGVPVFLHPDDLKLLKRANLFRMVFDGEAAVAIPPIERPLGAGDTPPEGFAVGGAFFVRYLETPGHTEGSVCFAIDDCLFVGDTLLPGKIGRTDLPGAAPKALASSLARLCALDPSARVFPGHGDVTSIGRELVENEALKRALADASEGLHAG